MDPNRPPETLGAFSPVGHVVVSFPSAEDTSDALGALQRAGYGAAEVVRYDPEQMLAQVEQETANASPIASMGQELNLVGAHGALAEQGYSFLVVKAPEEEQAREVARIAQRFRAERAQRYGRFIIEELIEAPGEERQVFESPHRGLDAQTPSGREEDRAKR
ncbi:hypothetical protein [Caldimonas thermodepolymerans]|jgi:hypothetical protein|uniref:hypothetical protein n=1 Tax=Caldimonas thermodepolymerans TaxID=215580 RepID=UPI00249015E2|nr:hypothetical protein [Caldimonas thermodepolymerans]